MIRRNTILRLLPRALQQALRRWHAPRVVARFTDADWPVAPVVRGLVKPGDTVVDVGANIGYLTARLADMVGPEGKVVSIEAVPDTFDLLTRSVNRLGLRQVRTIHACASNRVGELVMEIPSYQNGPENLYESRVLDPSESGGGGRRIPVRAVRLDDVLARENTTVTFVKIDVEGHEGPVLEGASRILEASRPALYIEVSGDPDVDTGSARALLKHLGEAGYHPYGWDGAGLHAREPGESSVDYFFLLPHHLDALGESGMIR